VRPAREAGAAASGLLGSAGILTGVAAATAVVGFASEEALGSALGSCSIEPTVALLAYSLGVVSLALLLVIAAHRVPGPRAAFAAGLVAVSVVGVVFCVALALLGAGFWTSARSVDGTAAVSVVRLFLIGVAAPSVATLTGALLILIARRRPMPRLLPAIVFLGLVCGSAVIVIASVPVACR
jgi:hypothetical protein